ncbi:hypothetical protein EWM64_g943 [Hericium alpestre]|uniref:RNA 3'-terminal phosphate cyclase domain-containing protein n=1 Tax=Hericium alpestre TaxID=135208 RepID=A0A4Z0A9Q8_9AGAM|nr:hypothetical protein EWM64_g943 [Hericium alpestre]
MVGLRLAAEICSASISGNRVGSTNISFTPDGIRLPINASADTGTAGSTALLIQIALPCLLFSRNVPPEPSSLTLRGGTNALSAPQIDYTQHVLMHFLQHRLGLAPQLTIKRRGYYPKGGGEIVFALRRLAHSRSVMLRGTGAGDADM